MPSTHTNTVSKRLQWTLAVVGAAAILTPLQAQVSAAPGAMAKPAASAVGATDHGKTGMGAHPMGTGGDMKSNMDDMHKQMSAMKSTGNPDVDFAMMMRIHHQAALKMAETQLRDGKDPQMKKMAKNIIAAQKKEIATFDKFLATKN